MFSTFPFFNEQLLFLTNKKIMQNNTLTAQQLLDLINGKINTGDYKDAVHKIKMMTARDMINEILMN